MGVSRGGTTDTQRRTEEFEKLIECWFMYDILKHLNIPRRRCASVAPSRETYTAGK